MTNTNAGDKSRMATPVTVPWFMDAKKRGEKFIVLSLYEAWSARLAQEAGARILLVGDSLATSIQGHDNTLPVTMDEMIYHTRAVRRVSPQAFVIGDMPFLSHNTSEADALRNAGRFLAEGGAAAVKVEGGVEIASVVRAMVERGIPVMGHIGMTPQHVHRFGGYKVRGKDDDDRRHLIADARALESAGAFAIVMELVTEETASDVTAAVRVPTIGIGAGRKVDAQVLVFHDMVGLNPRFTPKFLKRYAHLGEDAVNAVRQFAEDVASGVYPGEDNVFHTP